MYDLKEKEVFFNSHFWQLYPRKQAKKDALKAWLRVEVTEYEKIMSSLKAQIQSDAWKRDKGKYIPMPATWLNGNRWEDEVNTVQEDKNAGSQNVGSGGRPAGGYKSVHERNAEQNEVSRQAARAFFGVHRGGDGLVDNPDQGRNDTGGQDNRHGETRNIPALKTTKT
jgi:hypothetical protein